MDAMKFQNSCWSRVLQIMQNVNEATKENAMGKYAVVLFL